MNPSLVPCAGPLPPGAPPGSVLVHNPANGKRAVRLPDGSVRGINGDGTMRRVKPSTAGLTPAERAARRVASLRRASAAARSASIRAASDLLRVSAPDTLQNLRALRRFTRTAKRLADEETEAARLREALRTLGERATAARAFLADGPAFDDSAFAAVGEAVANGEWDGTATDGARILRENGAAIPAVANPFARWQTPTAHVSPLPDDDDGDDLLLRPEGDDGDDDPVDGE